VRKSTPSSTRAYSRWPVSQKWTLFGIVLALGMLLGGGGMYFSFVRPVAALNDHFEHLRQIQGTRFSEYQLLPRAGRNTGSTDAEQATATALGGGKGSGRCASTAFSPVRVRGSVPRTSAAKKPTLSMMSRYGNDHRDVIILASEASSLAGTRIVERSGKTQTLVAIQPTPTTVIDYSTGLRQAFAMQDRKVSFYIHVRDHEGRQTGPHSPRKAHV